MHGFGAGAHDHDHPFRLGIARVFEQSIAPPGQCGELCHHPLDDARTGVVERVGCLARLKENVGVLCRAAQHGPIGSESTLAMRLNGRLEMKLRRSSSLSSSIFADLVRGPEAVEEMQERNARFQRGSMSNRRQIVRLLNRV